jgi:hypothetical protein
VSSHHCLIQLNNLVSLWVEQENIYNLTNRMIRHLGLKDTGSANETMDMQIYLCYN